MRKPRLVWFLFAGAALATLAGCALAPRVQSRAEAEGFSTDALARINSVMRAEVATGTLPGAVTLIARNGHIVHFEAHGFLDAARTKPMARDAVFRILSMTKPFVSVAAMMLIERGYLRLGDPVTNWLPELSDMNVLVETRGTDGSLTREQVAARRPVTVHDLLRHTSGIPYTGNAPFPEIAAAYSKADVQSHGSDLSPEEFLARLGSIPLAWQPGSRFHYGLSTDVLGVLLERITGMRLDILLDEMIFRPLGMKDTGFQVKPDQFARLADALDSDPSKAWIWKWVRVEANPAKRYRLAGAGTVSTAGDYFRFAQMLVNGGELDGVRLLSRETVDLMLSDHIAGLDGSPESTVGPGYGFGLGLAVRRQESFAALTGSPSDATWVGAAGTSFTIDPREKIVGIFMAQSPTSLGHTRLLFRKLLYGALVN